MKKENELQELEKEREKEKEKEKFVRPKDKK